MPDLAALGWDAWFAERFAPFAEQGLIPARVAVQHNRFLTLLTDEGDVLGVIAGRLHHRTARRELPVAGDWVAIRPGPPGGKARVEAVVPRRTAFSRKVAGDEREEQLVAANVDLVLLMSGLDLDFNPRRIERYLVLARDSSVRPVIVLNKMDLCDDVGARVAEVAGAAGDVPVHPLCSLTGEGVDRIRTYLAPGRTVALLGSSGVGKSTLVNRLLGETRLATQAVRLSDHRGRHTTTWRELIVVPETGIVIDTPGMRELGLWEGEEGLQASFEDVEGLAAGCRFRDCRHRDEPDCALKAAVAAGTLPGARLSSYLKLQDELDRQARRHDRLAQQDAKSKVKAVMRDVNRRKRTK
jgi:ribosome biogenesis GTPase